MDWRMFGGNPSRNGQAVDVIKPPLRLAWTFQTQSYIAANPVINDAMLYFGTHDGMFYALDALNGQKIWEYCVHARVTACALLQNGVIYVPTIGAHLYALDARTGSLLWDYVSPIEKSFETLFEGADSHPIVVSSSSSEKVGFPQQNLFLINTVNGEGLQLLKNSVIGVSTPAIRDGVIYFGVLSEKVIAAVDIESMREIWERQTVSRLRVGPVIGGDMLYYGTKRNFMCCCDIRDGNSVWEFEILHDPIHGSCEGIESSPAIGGDSIYFGGPDGYFYSLEASTGLLLWMFREGNDLSSSPIISGDNVYFTSTGGNLYCLNRVTGKKEWEYKTERGFMSGPVIVGNMLFCASNTVYAFNVAT